MQGMFQIPPFDAPPTKTTVSTKEKNDRQTRNEPTIKKKKGKTSTHPYSIPKMPPNANDINKIPRNRRER
jgi:hypothetical protein